MKRLFLYLLVAATVTAAPPVKAQWAAIDSTATLGPGDQLRIAVWRRPELSGEFDIGADGSILHPIYRQINVRNAPISSIESQVRTVLSQFEANPTFVITPLIRVVVSGEVTAPNVYTMPVGETVAQAVARAGGPRERGTLLRVRVYRHGQSLVFDLTRPDTVSSAEILRSGDQVVVPRLPPDWLRENATPVAAFVAALASIIGIYFQVRHR